MRESDITATMTIRYVVEGTTVVEQATDKITAAQGKAAAAADALATATENSARRQASAAAALDALARKTDPAVRAMAELEKTYKDVTRALAFDQSPKAIDTANKALEVYRQRLTEAEAQQKLFFGTMSSKTLDKQFNIGGGMPAGSAMQSAAVFQKAEAEAAAVAQEKMAAAAMHLKAALNPLAAEEAKQVAELRLLKEAQQAGLITAEQFAGAQQMSATRLANLSHSLKTAGTAGRVMSGEMTNLGFQLNDVATGLALGQSPFMILAQQGGQIIQIFANSKASIADFARSSITWLGSLLTPMNLFIAGAVAASVVVLKLASDYDKLQVSSQRALIGAGQRTGTTVSDINQFTQQNSGLSGTSLSNKEARQLAEGLTATGDIVINKLHDMSDAVVGFSNQTGKSMDEAIKSFEKFGSDPKKALEELEGVFGPVNEKVRNLVETQSLAIDKTDAFNTVIDAFAEKSKLAAENTTLWAKAVNSVRNFLGTETIKPSGSEAQLESVRARLNSAIETPASMQGGLSGQSAAIESLSREFEKVQQAREKAIGGTATAQLNALSTDAARAAEQVAAIAKSWGDVRQATALALNALQQQASIAGAVTGQQQMAAQYAADFANAALEGKTEIEAEALATGKLQVAQAAATTAIEKQIEALEDSNDMLKAQLTGTEKSTAARIAYNNAIKSGASEASAAALSIETARGYTIRAAAAALEWQQNMLGVSDAARQAAASIDAAATAAYYAKNPSSDMPGGNAGGGTFNPQTMTQSGAFSTDPSLSVHYRGGAGPGTRIGGFVSPRVSSSINPDSIVSEYVSRGDYAGAILAIESLQPSGMNRDGTSSGGIDVNTQMSQVDQLTQILNSQTSDKGTQIQNLQAEMSWLNKLPETIARDQKIISLQHSIDQLKQSTDGLNATNKDLLSPYYSQDPRTSHIGFRSQGMASGGSFVVPGGYSSNDNMIGEIPLASGEVVSVGRPGESGATQVVIHQNITIQGNASKDEVGRTMYQNAQTLGRRLKASG